MGSVPNVKLAPWTYMLIRMLFKFVLKVFYSSIVIENENFIPGNGRPTIICANHGNSLTDALMLITSVSSKKRNYLRMTAKATLFGKRTFSSWLIENVGSVPIKRRQDNPEDSDNTIAMNSLTQALEEGDVICLFPEGMSKFQSKLSPLKSGVARIASDVLTRNAANPDFELTLLTCSITYVHPQRFRSDVLVTFHPPLHLRPSTHPSLVRDSPTSPPPFDSIQSLTRLIQTQISSGTIDAPSWEIVRISKTAARMYSPLGTRMSLGDWIRVVRTFVGGFAQESGGLVVEPGQGPAGTDPDRDRIEILALIRDLKAYQDNLVKLGVKDDRVRRLVSRPTMAKRILFRTMWLCILLPITLPGLTLWLSVFATASYFGEKMKKSGPAQDVWDEIAQQKLIYGLLSGGLVWLICAVSLLPFSLLMFPVVPLWMWMTLRWFEDLVSTFRAIKALSIMLMMPPKTLAEMQEKREELHERVHAFALRLGLPDDPEDFFVMDPNVRKGKGIFESSTDGEDDGETRTSAWGSWFGGPQDRSQKGRARLYFSIVRRRKRDWNETLKWYDMTEFPEDATKIE
ncbi:hypothetical protein BS47DRAFT_1372291 [Hydnum rufescens UP504]|uniref:Phospholipid/glycerol acyltransferase domain-containing protein n=1 Tax=Hydnum rufescens UP504 TaxID=1448309 RepID=A0A9P6AZ98_9AGAM|nr:hypothetical protein BS47DRAFT_1372291 [Hydnum rufescens UP504]